MDERQVNCSYFMDEKIKLKKEKASGIKLTQVNSMLPTSFELSLEELCPKYYVQFSVNQATLKISASPLAFAVILKDQNALNN